MNTPFVDCHTHASFSDGASTFEENVRAAAAAGLSVLACTDHLTLPASMERVADAQVPLGRLCERRAAFEAARELAAEVAPSLTLVYGFECDWYPGCEPNVACWAPSPAPRCPSPWEAMPIAAATWTTASRPPTATPPRPATRASTPRAPTARGSRCRFASGAPFSAAPSRSAPAFTRHAHSAPAFTRSEPS